MSNFTPLQNYRVNFRTLEPGNIIKIQDSYYMVIAVRENRKAVSVTGAQTKYILALDNSATSGTSSSLLESMTGNLNKNRIVHIQYLAVTVADTPEFYWGILPLQSKDVDDVTSQTLASVSQPLIVDRWSYDASMRLLVTQGNVSQVYNFLIKEYEIVSYAGAPPMPYLQLLSNGFGIYVENNDMASNLKSTKLGVK